MKNKILALLLCSSFIGIAQNVSSSAEEIKTSIKTQKELQNTSIVKNIPFKNIGPTVMSGRVVDLAVNPDNPVEFYVAYASGGVWLTKDNGISFTSITDNAPTQNIGTLAVDWKNQIIWVGTGENNSSRSSYAGIGLLKTTDFGKTWEHKGLFDSHHIGKILLNPEDTNHIVVGVTGHLYSPNKERGIYITKDGGETWTQSLFINEETGIIDMMSVPTDFSVQYATAWEKDRKAWNFKGNGENSGIYKSEDGGESWNKISTKESGFPTGEGVGRIGVAVFDKNIIYAIHDSQFRREEKNEEKGDELKKDDFKTITKEAFLKLGDKKLNTFLRDNRFPKKYTAKSVKASVRKNTIEPKDIALYLEDENALLFDVPVVGAEVYKSLDGGVTWQKTHKDYLDDIYYSYGYYFGHIHVSPTNSEKIYIYGVPILTSSDGGKNFKSIVKPNVHSDHHALWINPKSEGHLINGNDGGVNITYDDGNNWMKNNSPTVGQFYAINVDNEKPYNVYGGLQDNGVWKGRHNASVDERWHASGHNPWKSIMGGDGMQIQIDKRNSNIVYTGFQFGNYFRLDLENGKRTYIQPKHELGNRPYRFNWQTPILLSTHNQDILYLGSNHLHRSLNQGDTWEVISKDLTQGGKKGNVSYGTLTTISESPYQFGHLYVGSDDGYIHYSENGGGSWKRISDSFPKNLWVSRVVASKHKKERVYATLNGYRWDDFTPYVYMSDDYGTTWKPIQSNLPTSPVNVIIEDAENENILYLGNDQGTYVSFNHGKSWETFAKGLTNAAVHDLVIQPEAKHLLIGTHGRSIYKTDISYFEGVNEQFLQKELHLFPISEVNYNKNWGKKYNTWREALESEIRFALYAKNNTTYTLTITDKKGMALYQSNGDIEKGFNFIPYNLSAKKSLVNLYNKKNKTNTLKAGENERYYLPKGEFKVTIKTANTSKTQKLIIK